MSNEAFDIPAMQVLASEVTGAAFEVWDVPTAKKGENEVVKLASGTGYDLWRQSNGEDLFDFVKSNASRHEAKAFLEEG